MIIKRNKLWKAIGYRVSAFCLITLVSYIFTWKIEISLFIAISEFIIKLIMYYAYDILWDKIEPKLVELWQKIKKIFGGK